MLGFCLSWGIGVYQWSDFPESADISPSKTLGNEKEFLQKAMESCGDCHSLNPKIPAYGYFFPISNYLKGHVREGLEEFNLSDWNSYGYEKKMDLLYEMIQSVEEGSMPPGDYRWMHPSSLLTSQELESWKKFLQELEEENER